MLQSRYFVLQVDNNECSFKLPRSPEQRWCALGQPARAYCWYLHFYCIFSVSTRNLVPILFLFSYIKTCLVVMHTFYTFFILLPYDFVSVTVELNSYSYIHI